VYLSSLLAGWLEREKNSFLGNNCNKEEIIAMRGKKSERHVWFLASGTNETKESERKKKNYCEE
jgi:hypothetical protein